MARARHYDSHSHLISDREMSERQLLGHLIEQLRAGNRHPLDLDPRDFEYPWCRALYERIIERDSLKGLCDYEGKRFNFVYGVRQFAADCYQTLIIAPTVDGLVATIKKCSRCGK